MKNIAVGVLLIILVSIVVEPLVEMGIVFREKVVLSTAISNACRAAKDRSLEYELLRGLDAVINEERFKEYFSDAFESALNVSEQTDNGNVLTFTSNDDRYNDFTVNLDFSNIENTQTSQWVSEVNVKAQATYKFKTRYLKLAEEADKEVDYQLISERKYILSVKN
ncbi:MULTISPECIES: hypothetical protein [Paenibacillus]|uniref:Prepilin-type N-terminal cleavage/methylation domain-containing protein n=1 Tax=Paenibacillus odorifer TaxID=189426 RepID=A0A1R0X039_9BACL|nr:MULTISPECIES: hypothetical protein [Paenibacillus]AIQ73269.1 hypothetical protein PODO_08380 [Paenibacillus odorifer]ETT55323.1 hypothetical protein C171_20087 [Paenibacillus sp. FSL H8-237]OMC95774.1 hypothetical protein BJP49_13205 [Paenibacillus odorifer]OMD02811.1 hypothetical protein BJP46_15285 [Paenibacillus odorifer]OMD06586.1 hypothetical protein BJP47_13345 [Paenibacillus odorifer]